MVTVPNILLQIAFFAWNIAGCRIPINPIYRCPANSNGKDHVLLKIIISLFSKNSLKVSVSGLH